MSKPAPFFRGAYTAIVTPFTSDGEAVDFDRLAEQIQFQAKGGVTGIVPCGTTGESPTLSEDEHHQVIESAIEIGRPLGLKIIAGCGSNNTQHAIELQRFAHEAGADAALQVNPYYNKPSQEGLYRHFMAIADACDLPICLYNIPGRTGVALAPETVERLAKHPNIQAIKEATGSLDSASEIISRTGRGESLALLSGDDSLTLPFASVGGVGVVSVVTNIEPKKISAMCGAFNAGKWDEARRLHFDLLPLSRGLLSLDTNPIPVKTAMAILGRDGGALRLPMCPPSKSAREAIEKLLAGAGLIKAGSSKKHMAVG
jgi:4-hydroxy-tetrahydrodipicolinate synthase